MPDCAILDDPEKDARMTKPQDGDQTAQSATLVQIMIQMAVLNEKFVNVEKILQAMHDQFVTRKEYDGHDERLKRIEGWLGWIAKGILGAVMVAILGLVLVGRSGGLNGILR